MKMRHSVDDAILVSKKKQVAVAVAVTALIAAGTVAATPNHDTGLKMRHDTCGCYR